LLVLLVLERLPATTAAHIVTSPIPADGAVHTPRAIVLTPLDVCVMPPLQPLSCAFVPATIDPAELLKEPEQELPRHGPATKPLKLPAMATVYVSPGEYDVTALPVTASRTEMLCPFPFQLPWPGCDMQPYV
jgi:hypothetical protein